jgi:hypothetical protein
LTSLTGVKEEPGSPKPSTRLEVRTVNPEELVLELPGPALVSVTVHDAVGMARVSVVGHVQMETGSHRISLALPGLENGVYLLSVQAGSATRTARVVMAR